MWFQHDDGAPPHVVKSVRDQLDQEFPGWWIGRFGPRAWFTWSPDVTLLDFFLWGYVMKKVFDREWCDTAAEMRSRITSVSSNLNARSTEDPCPSVNNQACSLLSYAMNEFELFLVGLRPLKSYISWQHFRISGPHILSDIINYVTVKIESSLFKSHINRKYLHIYLSDELICPSLIR